MGRLFDIVEQYRDRFEPHRPTVAAVAREIGTSRQNLLNWRTPSALPRKEHLLALAKTTGVPYQRVLDAALDDIGYLHPGE